MTSTKHKDPGLWPILREEEILHTPIFSLRRREARSPRTKDTGEFYVLDTPDWVNVVALTDDAQVVLIEQYRHGVGEVTLEIPGGLIDPDDADPCAAAARELREETGYVAKDVKLLGYVTPNPAIQSNRCYTCLATGLGIRGAQELDTDEDIEVSSVSPQEISGLIASGAISHALVVSAFAFFFGLALPNSAIEAALSSRFIEVPHES